MLVSCTDHLLIAFAVPNSLYFASVIIGLCFGAQWPLMFAIISEIFGLYNFGAVASPVGSYILNVMVAGKLYDQEAKKQMDLTGRIRQDGEDLSCTSVHCYRTAFIIITAATLFGCTVSAVLVFRTRKFYKGDIYRKFREQDASVVVVEDNMELSGIGDDLPLKAGGHGNKEDGKSVRN